jgi:integrase
MGKPSLALIVPSPVSGTVKKPMPNRRANDQLRGRQHLSECEVALLEKAARANNRWGHRDATMVMTAFRHGLRAMELVSMTWDQVDLTPASFTCAGSRTRRRQPTSSTARRSVLSAGSNGNSNHRARSSSPPRERARSRRRGSARCWRGWGWRPGSSSRSIRTCSAMAPVSSSPTTASIQGRSRTTSGTRASPTRCVIPG